jgi:hypothetical protein
LDGKSFATLAGYAIALSALVIVTRWVWFFTVPYLIRPLDGRPSQRAQQTVQTVPATQRETLVRLRDAGEVSNEVIPTWKQ